VAGATEPTVTLEGIDDLDRRILHALQTDARGASSGDLARRAGVSASTVRKRIARLEDEGIVTGYRATVDYERAGYQLHVQVACTAPVAERDTLAADALGVPGVVGVRALATGERNVIVTVVGADGDDLTRIATRLNDLGLTVLEEELLRSDEASPFAGFDVAAEEEVGVETAGGRGPGDESEARVDGESD
jgi:DNA-binding Lrp family transcriptional regulator